MSLNHISIMGRLTANPELRRTATGTAVTSFTLAVDRDYSKDGSEKETDFIECVAWKGTAEFVSKHFTKGKMAIVAGRLQTRNWDDKDGNKRKTTEVLVQNMYFGEPKKSTSDQLGEAMAASKNLLPDFVVLDGDSDDLTFPF